MRPATRQTLIDAARRVSARLPQRWDRTAREAAKIALNYRGSRGALVRHLRYAVVRKSAPLLVAPLGPGQIIFDAGDEEVGRQVFVNGGYERWHMEAALDELARASVPTAGRLFLDVGANIGTSTIDALLQFGFGRAMCFEPAADNVRLLRANLLLNGLEERAEVHPVAVSDRDGTGILTGSAANSGDRRFIAATGSATGTATGANGTGPALPCRRLDSYVEDGRLDPAEVGLVWIDVQGHEPHVLRGAKVAIAPGVPVVLEYCPWVLGAARADLDAQIAERFSTLVDLRALAGGVDPESARLTPADLPGLAARYQRHGYTDLLLLS